MLEHWRPLTGILAATCLWAVSVLAIALAGFGGRVAPLPDDPSIAPPIPTVRLVPVANRLGAFEEYAEVGSRPLLNSDRRPAPVGPVAGEGGTNELDVALTSVLITPRLQMAIFTDNNGGASRRVRVGEVVQGTSWTLVDVQPRMVRLSGPGGEKTLELRVYNGIGGAPPSPVVAEGGDPQAQATPPGAPEATAPVEGPASVPVPAPAPQPQPAQTLTQEQQIEAIRRRIEARRAQMREEAARQAGDKR